MSGDGFGERKSVWPQDPVWRVVAGCAVVVAGFVVLLVVSAVLIGWRLSRDEAPGRPVETFLVGDEARYWSVSLKPEDAGLQSFFARLGEINDTTRRNVLRGTFLESIPLPHRTAKLDELAPFAFELSMAAAELGSDGQAPAGWAARATFSHHLFRMRAAVKLIRFLASRDATKADTVDVDGVPVTVVRDNNAGFALAAVGNRVLVASDAARMRSVLQPVAEIASPALRELLALHEAIKLDGEDAWAFYANARSGGLAPPVAEQGALASFDVNERDELAFRISVSSGAAVEGGGGFVGTTADCTEVVAHFLPGVPVSAIAIDGEGAHEGPSRSKEFSGRVSGLSKRLAELLQSVTVMRRSRTPFASPTPPSLPTSADPRSDTPAGPTHEGTPTPRR